MPAGTRPSFRTPRCCRGAPATRASCPSSGSFGAGAAAQGARARLMWNFAPRAIENSGIEKYGGAWLNPGIGPIVQRQRHLVAVEIDLEHAVDRLPDRGELVERRLEKALL